MGSRRGLELPAERLYEERGHRVTLYEVDGGIEAWIVPLDPGTEASPAPCVIVHVPRAAPDPFAWVEREALGLLPPPPPPKKAKKRKKARA
jgi:hypothetical protein